MSNKFYDRMISDVCSLRQFLKTNETTHFEKSPKIFFGLRSFAKTKTAQLLEANCEVGLIKESNCLKMSCGQ